MNGSGISGPGLGAGGALGLWGACAVVAGAYLLGSVSWSYLIVRLTQGRDVRTLGSGNAGATNVMRTAGKAAGVAALVLDCGKGVAAVVGARALGAGPALAAAAAGALGALAPGVLALDLVLFIAVVAWKRYVSLGSIVAAAAFPFLLAACERLGWESAGGPARIAWSVVVVGLILVRHRGNLDRLHRGVEPRLGEARRTVAPPPAAAGGREP